MTDDLISRKAALEVIRGILNTSVGFTCGLEEMIAMVKTVPSVPAVPLDKLCEWLENVFKDPPCMLDNMVQCKQECRGFQKVKYRDCWRYFLNKLMEEQDEADRP